MLLGLVLLAAAVAPTHITGMELHQRGVDPGPRYHVQVTVRVRVCGHAGRAAFRVTETSSPPERNSPVFARQRRSFRRAQPRRCTTHALRWRMGDRFFGVSRYRVAVRARTTGRAWSGVVARHRDTFD